MEWKFVTKYCEYFAWCVLSEKSSEGKTLLCRLRTRNGEEHIYRCSSQKYIVIMAEKLSRIYSTIKRGTDVSLSPSALMDTLID